MISSGTVILRILRVENPEKVLERLATKTTSLPASKTEKCE